MFYFFLVDVHRRRAPMRNQNLYRLKERSLPAHRVPRALLLTVTPLVARPFFRLPWAFLYRSCDNLDTLYTC